MEARSDSLYKSLALRRPPRGPSPHLLGGWDQLPQERQNRLVKLTQDALGEPAIQQRELRAERYRRKANRYAEFAKNSSQPEFVIKLAIRYILMAEDVEKCLKPQVSAATSYSERGRK